MQPQQLRQTPRRQNYLSLNKREVKVMAPSKTASSRIKTKVFFINDAPQLLFEERSIVDGSFA